MTKVVAMPGGHLNSGNLREVAILAFNPDNYRDCFFTFDLSLMIVINAPGGLKVSAFNR